MSEIESISIPDALALEEKEIIPAIEGVLVWVGDRRSGTSKHGEYSFQPAILKVPDSEKDDPDSSIKVTFRNRKNDMAQFAKKHVRIECFEGNEGLAGVMRSIDTYKDRNEPEILAYVDPVVVGEGKTSAPAKKSAPAKAQGRSGGYQKRKPQGNITEGLDEYLDQMKEVRIKCEEKAMEVIDTVYGDDHTREHVQVIASGFFISACRKAGL